MAGLVAIAVVGAVVSAQFTARIDASVAGRKLAPAVLAELDRVKQQR